jgi:hypothetical protein
MAKLKSIYQLAHQLENEIGKHRQLSDHCDNDVYWRARADSDHAISTAKYLIQYMPRVQADIIRAVVGAHL